MATVMVPLAWIWLNRSPPVSSVAAVSAVLSAVAALSAVLPQAVRASAAVRVRAVSLARFFIIIDSFVCMSAKIPGCGAAAGR